MTKFQEENPKGELEQVGPSNDLERGLNVKEERKTSGTSKTSDTSKMSKMSRVSGTWQVHENMTIYEDMRSPWRYEFSKMTWQHGYA